jgi:hypothetical protein
MGLAESLLPARYQLCTTLHDDDLHIWNTECPTPEPIEIYVLSINILDDTKSTFYFALMSQHNVLWDDCSTE